MEKEEDEFTKQTSKTITRDEGKTHTNLEKERENNENENEFPLNFGWCYLV